MIYIIDTHPWIEYFLGTKIGLNLKKLFENQNNKFITLECCLAELRGYCLKNKYHFDQILNIVKRNSFIFPVMANHWIEAGKIRFELRKKIKNFGLIDAILLSKQKELDCKLVSGDYHFKNMKNIVFIGS